MNLFTKPYSTSAAAKGCLAAFLLAASFTPGALGLNPIAQQAFVKSAPGYTMRTRDHFGFSVALSGDTMKTISNQSVTKPHFCCSKAM